MKTIATLLLLAIATAANSQVFNLSEIPFNNEKIAYEKIEEVSNQKAEIFSSAKKALITIYNNAENVIQYENLQDGTLIGKALFSSDRVGEYGKGLSKMSWLWEFKIKYTIRIDIKDNKYRLQIYDFLVEEKVDAYSGSSVNHGIYSNPKNLEWYYECSKTNLVDGKQPPKNRTLKTGYDEALQNCFHVLKEVHTYSIEMLNLVKNEISKELKENSDEW